MASINATADLFSVLDQEWDQLCARPSTAATVARWGTEDAVLSPFRRMADVVAYIEDRGTPGAERDEVMSALAVRASADDLAARALLQLTLPGIKSLLRRFFWNGDAERTADLVAFVYGRIRTFGSSPRPTWVANRLFECARKRLRTTVDQQRRRSRHEEQLLSRRHGGVPAFGGPEPSASELLEGHYAEEPQPTPADELADLLEWATAEGHLREGEAELIRLYRLSHVSADELGAIQGGAPAAVERRRQRAEARLVAAVRVA